MATFETDYQDTVVCPACGSKESYPSEIDFGPGLDGDAETNCASCGASLFVLRHVTVMYSAALLRSPSTRFSQKSMDGGDYVDNDPALIAAAAEASDLFGDDECEAFAAELRASRSGGAM